MSKAWKWILAILAALIIVGVVVAVVFVWRNHAPLALASRVTRMQQYAQPAPGTPAAPGAPTVPNNQGSPYGFGRGDRGFFQGPGGRMPMMGGRGYRNFGGLGLFGMGFFLLGGLLHLIIPLGVLVLVAILFYTLGKRAGASSVAPTPPSNPTPPAAPGSGRRVAKS